MLVVSVGVEEGREFLVFYEGVVKRRELLVKA